MLNYSMGMFRVRFLTHLKAISFQFLLIMHERAVQPFRPTFTQLHPYFCYFYFNLLCRGLQQVVGMSISMLFLPANGVGFYRPH